MGAGPPQGGMGQQPQGQSQSQSMASPGMPQQTQGLGALQNAYSQFQNSAPPQPNPMFGEQPNPAAQAPQVSNVLDAYMDVGQQPDHGPPGPEGYARSGFGQPDYNAMPPDQRPDNRMMGNPQQMQQRMQEMQQRMQQQMAQRNPMRPPMMPQASNFSQMRQEDPRMQAMRNMQRYRGGR